MPFPATVGSAEETHEEASWVYLPSFITPPTEFPATPDGWRLVMPATVVPQPSRATLQARPTSRLVANHVYLNVDRTGGAFVATADAIATVLDPNTQRNTVVDRFGLDIITDDGALLMRQLETGVVQPHMFGASTVDDDDTDQHAYFQSMASLAADEDAIEKHGLSFVVPKGFWRIDQSLELFELKAHWHMEGVLRAPNTVSPFPIIRYKGLPRDPVIGSGKETGRPLNRLCAFRQHKDGSDLPMWDDDVILQPGWDAGDRENWAKHQDIAIEITKILSEKLRIGYAGGCMIGCGIRAVEDDPDSSASQGAKLFLEITRSNRVSCLLAVHGTGPGLVWIGGIELDYGDRIGDSVESPQDRSFHALITTASGTNWSPPNSITITGGIKDNLKRFSTIPGAPRSSSFLIDRGIAIRHIGDIRMEDNSGNNEFAPVEFPNKTPGEATGNVFNFITTVGPIRHNQLFNPVTTSGSRSSVVRRERTIASLHVRQCYWGGKTRVYLPAPWVRVRQSQTGHLPYLLCDGSGFQDAQGLEPVQRPTYVEVDTNARQLVGVFFDVLTMDAWNRITVHADRDVVAYIAAFDSGGSNLSADLAETGVNRWIGLHHISSAGGRTLGGFDYRNWPGDAAEMSVSLNNESPIARIFVSVSGTRIRFSDVTITSEGLKLRPTYSLAPRQGFYMDAAPEKGYWDLGQTIDTDSARIRCTTSGFAVTADWSASLAVAARDWLFNAGNIYQVVVGGTTGGTAPVHTTGTVNDGGVDLLFVGTGAKAVFA